MLSKIILIFYNIFLSPLPSCRVLRLIKVAALRAAGVCIGRSCEIEPRVTFSVSGGNLVIGNNVLICQGVYIQCGGEIEIGNCVEVNSGTLLSANGNAKLSIGNNCHIAHFCSLKCSTQIVDPSLARGSIVNGSEFKDIHIGAGTWICAGVIVLPGVSVGAFNVVAAGSVVTKDSPEGVLLAGVPAVVKKRYLTDGGNV